MLIKRLKNKLYNMEMVSKKAKSKLRKDRIRNEVQGEIKYNISRQNSSTRTTQMAERGQACENTV